MGDPQLSRSSHQSRSRSRRRKKVGFRSSAGRRACGSGAAPSIAACPHSCQSILNTCMKSSRQSHRYPVPSLLFAAALAWTLPVKAANPVLDAERAEMAVRSFIAAQLSCDQGAMAELLAPDYLEVSPLGRVDNRQDVIHFYSEAACGKSTTGAIVPEAELGDARAMALDEHVVLVTRLTLTMQGANGWRKSSMRATYVLDSGNGNWRIHLAQFTPIIE